MSEPDLKSRVTALEAQVAALRMVIEKIESRLDEAESPNRRRPKPVRATLADQLGRSMPEAPIETNPKPPRGPMLD